MRLLSLIISEEIKDYFRPELKIKKERVDLLESNPSTEGWVLQHTYLCEGGLKDLENHPDYDDPTIDYKVAYFANSLWEDSMKPHKMVRVSIERKSEEKAMIKEMK